MTKTCSFTDCAHVARCKGFCAGHYAQVQRGEEMHPLKRHLPYPPCAIEGCDQQSYLRSEQICSRHYFRRYRGFPLEPDDRPCDNCGQTFTPTMTRPNVRYCSRKCKGETTKLQAAYGFTGVELRRMLAAQDGHCAICPTPIEPGVSTCVDHCHTTGAVRGVLCGHCNSGLGYFRDNPEYLASAISYLGR